MNTAAACMCPCMWHVCMHVCSFRIFQLSHIVLHSYQSVQCVRVFCSYAWNLVDIILTYITFSVSMYIMCVCLFSALSRRVGTLQITIIIIIIPLQQHLAQWQCWLLFTNDHTRHFFKRCDICKVAKGGSWKLVNHCNWSDSLCQTTTRTLEANTLLPSRKTPNYLPFPSTAHPPTRTLSLYCFFYVWEPVEQNNSWYCWPIADFCPSIC